MKEKARALFRSLFHPNSLSIQLLSRSLLILAVLLALIGLLQYIFMKDVIYRNEASNIQSRIISIPRHVWEQLDQGQANRLIFFLPGANLAFIDQEGNYYVLSIGPDGINPPKLTTQEYLNVLKKPPLFDEFDKTRLIRYKVLKDSEGIEQLLVMQPVLRGQAQGIIQVSTLTGPLKELLLRQLFTFLILSFIAMLFGLLCFSPIIRKTLVPLFNMVDTAEQIDAGNLDRRFPTRQGQMEVDRLAESFNGMLERLEASFEAERETKEQMRRFIADASHELRTPLTSIHGFLEVLLRGAANQPDQLNKALRSMHGESKRLNKLVHDLLLLSRLDRTPHIELAEGFLDSLIREMEPQLHILAGKRKLDLFVERDLMLRYDADSMKQVVLNLFQNAVQHTDPENGRIQIFLSKRNDGVRLSVQDNGSGISESHLPHVFDRFYRSDSSRTRKYGGAGLGLAITKTIIDIHKGTISIESKEGQGCIFHIWLPDNQ